MPQKKIAIEFDGSVTDARALARAVGSVLDASRVDAATLYIEGFAMNRSDAGWLRGDASITVIER